MDLRHNAACLLSTTILTSLAVEAVQAIYTVPAGKVCILAFAFLEADDDLADNGDVSIGTGVHGSADNFVGDTAINNLNADGDVILLAPLPSATPATLVTYAAAAVINLDVVAACAAKTGTCYLFGFLYNA